MGMFDTLIVEYPLPDLPYPELQDTHWQTKAFDCLLGLYVIRADGTVAERHYDIEETDGEPNPTTGMRPIKRLDTYTDHVLEDFHADVRFYEIWYTPDQQQEWVEYSARFTDGKLSRVHLVEHRPFGTHPLTTGTQLLQEAEALLAYVPSQQAGQTPPNAQPHPANRQD